MTCLFVLLLDWTGLDWTRRRRRFARQDKRMHTTRREVLDRQGRDGFPISRQQSQQLPCSRETGVAVTPHPQTNKKRREERHTSHHVTHPCRVYPVPQVCRLHRRIFSPADASRYGDKKTHALLV